MKFSRRVQAGVFVFCAVVAGGLTGHLARGQSPRREWVPTIDEVRDAERIKSARIQLDQQTQLLLQRAQARLGLKDVNLSYDFEKTCWFEIAPISTETHK